MVSHTLSREEAVFPNPRKLAKSGTELLGNRCRQRGLGDAGSTGKFLTVCVL